MNTLLSPPLANAYSYSRIASALGLLLMASTANAYEFSYKGLIKPEIVHTDSAVGSYGSSYSHVAPTHALRTDFVAGNPATAQQTTYLESASTSFQAAHSRFSLNMNHNKVRTVVEFDFIDDDDGFSNQTAIQAQGVRLRLATLYFDATDHITVFGGQKWSTAAGIKSNGSYNWIGNGFRAGNTGFLAMEFGATYRNDGLSLTGAITGKGRNNSSQGINANELGGMPGVAFDANYSASGFLIGAAGHIATINFENEPTYVSGSDQDSNLFKVYGTYSIGSVTFNAEYYVGEALNNQNALGIAPAASLNAATGVVRESFGESGFFTYVNWAVKKGHTVKAGYTAAEVDSGDQSRLSRMELSSNSTMYINYGTQVAESLTLFAQVTRFDTEYGVDFEAFSAIEGRVGVIFKF